MAKKNKNGWCVNVIECGNHAAPDSLYCWSCKPKEQKQSEQPPVYADPVKSRFVDLFFRHHKKRERGDE